MSKGIGIVQTQYGKLRGVEAPDGKYEGITYFKGVPYAKAPVGELRWRPPVDHEGWEGVRDAVNYAPAETQKRISGWLLNRIRPIFTIWEIRCAVRIVYI